MSAEKPVNYDQLISLSPPEKYISRFSSNGAANLNPNQPVHWFRSEFMRDRDRIAYSKAFRRLSGKTQVFFANFDDHARTRLTHTLEVAQLARTVAKALKLDVDLAEAIALGHDLGHTPFGHIGEQALSRIMSECVSAGTGEKSVLRYKDENYRGFKHNHQSVRVTVDLERSFKQVPGLNLTNFTLFGIRYHTRTEWKRCDQYKNKAALPGANCLKSNGVCCRGLHVACPNNFQMDVGYYLNKYNRYLKVPDQFACNENSGGTGRWAWSFEACVVSLCDEIAQRHHDLEDGLETKIITIQEVMESIRYYFGDQLGQDDIDRKNFEKFSATRGIDIGMSHMSRFIISFYLRALIENSLVKLMEFARDRLGASRKTWEEQYLNLDMGETLKLIGFSSEFSAADKNFCEKFLKRRILQSFRVQRMDGIGSMIVEKLFFAYLHNPQQLPDKTIYVLFKNYNQRLINWLWKMLGRDSSFGERFLEAKEKKDFAGTDSLPKQDNTSDEIMFRKIVSRLRICLERKRDIAIFKPFLYRTIADYISGMTDSYALKEYHQLFGHLPIKDYS